MHLAVTSKDHGVFKGAFNGAKGSGDTADGRRVRDNP